ncbi:hypothetical protein C0J52_27339 [Blattella germanica]|nr:hypothetical protein C0J52_27339 [Blattella germanica]
MLRSPTKSVRKLAQETNISLRTAYKAVKEQLHLHPFKFTVVQELHVTDYLKRIRYCEWFNRFIRKHRFEILNRTFFTDEAWFHLSGFINPQNSRIWTTENPHALKETALHSEKIGVWVSISKSRIIGPLFYDTTVDSDVYIDQIIYPFLSLLNEDEIQCCFFQQDNVTHHTSNKS